MRTRPRIARNGDGVGGTGSANGGNCGIGSRKPLFGGHAVWFIHQAENHFAVAFELGGEARPKIGKRTMRQFGRTNHFTLPTGVIVRVDDGGHALRRYAIHQSSEPPQFGGIEGLHERGLQPFPAEGYANGVHALVAEIGHAADFGVNVMCAVGSGEITFPKFSACQTHAAPLGRGCSGAGIRIRTCIRASAGIGVGICIAAGLRWLGLGRGGADDAEAVIVVQMQN